MSEYLFGKGRVLVGKRTAGGNALNLRFVGDCSEFKIALATEKREIKESHSGQNLTAATVNVGKSATLSLNPREFSVDNLALALYGTSVSQASGEVTSEVLGTVAVGDIVPFTKTNVSDVEVVDSTGSPITLVAGTHYIVNARHGSIEIKALPVGVTQPLKASYSYGEAKSVAAFTAQSPDRFVRFEGYNLATDEAVVVECYKVRFNPLSELSVIGDDFGGMSMEADVLIDSTKQIDGELGQFARIIKIAA